MWRGQCHQKGFTGKHYLVEVDFGAPGPISLLLTSPVLILEHVNWIARYWILWSAKPNRLVRSVTGSFGDGTLGLFFSLTANHSLLVLKASFGKKATWACSIDYQFDIWLNNDSYRDFSAFAKSHSPSSIFRWSGLKRESVGATPSSGSLSWTARTVMLYIFSYSFLKTTKKQPVNNKKCLNSVLTVGRLFSKFALMSLCSPGAWTLWRAFDLNWQL